MKIGKISYTIDSDVLSCGDSRLPDSAADRYEEIVDESIRRRWPDAEIETVRSLRASGATCKSCAFDKYGVADVRATEQLAEILGAAWQQLHEEDLDSRRRLAATVRGRTKLTKDDYRKAIVMQDACNLCGVVQSFAEVMKKILDGVGSTDEANRHPIAVLYASKIESLTRLWEADAFTRAYHVCIDRAKEEEREA